MQKYLSPADIAISAFGGCRATAKAIGRDHSSVVRWRKRKNGSIPEAALRPLYELAKARGIELNAEELIVGRQVPA
ncbi:MAG: hypothetical protein EON58_11295 [Alphaproteobacteria bacterium]|nr:MAG: hypothetical protein EON58_11295 [Alphaproteobacteria bacterium]